MLRRAQPAVLALLFASLAAAQEREAPRVRVAVSVDWEGRELAEENLAAIESLRRELPDVPLTHFLNAAYFTKPGAGAERTTAAIRRAIRPGDETGLHVHGWRSLVEASGVRFRTSPRYWGDEFPLHETGGDLGQEVELPAYSTGELRSILATSRRILREQGFAVSRSFRAGGWLADPAVLAAIRAEGFRIDSSATDATWHDEIAAYRIHGRIRELWPGVTAQSPPYPIDTPAGRLLEMPDTGALADYVTAAEMAAHLREAAGRIDGGDLYVHIGFHQETAARYSGRVIEAIRAVRRDDGAPYAFETLEASARRVAPEILDGP